MLRPLLLAAAWLLCAATAQAHKASDAYLSLRVEAPAAMPARVQVRFDIALRDLDRELDLDRNADDALSWGEVSRRWADIAALARAGLRMTADGHACTAQPADDAPPALTTHSDGEYAVLRGVWSCPGPAREIALDYRLFEHSDPTHRGIARLMASGLDDALATAVLVPGGPAHRFRLPAAAPSAAVATDTAPAPALAAPLPATATATATATVAATPVDDVPTTFPGFVREGVHHILIGTDHILFLLSLLLPAVWVRRGGWQPAPDWRPALLNVLKVVTAFTVAHSITLALAAFDIVNPPSRWVESLIAASVVAAALNNLRPVISEARWKLTFVFGLVHGFGFASALKDAGLTRGALVAPLVGFNLGVELGQLLIVALCLPLAWGLRGTAFYRGSFRGGSWAIAGVAGVWLVERAFDLRLISG